MIWLTWRQFRIQALVGAAAVVAVVAVFAASRPALLDLARDTGFTGCTTNCAAVADTFLNQARASYGQLYNTAMFLLFLLPALIGLFWGAPLLARELEAGTHRLVWNQSVSPARWLAVKLAAVGLAAAAVAGLISLAVTWWAAPIDRADSRMGPLVFAVRGVVPIGYALFAFAAGATVGLLLRRTVPAMAVTLVVVAAALVASPLALRGHLAARGTYEGAVKAESIDEIRMKPDQNAKIWITVAAPLSGVWELSSEVLTSTGRPFTGPADLTKCGPDATGGRRDCTEWLASQNLQQRVVYLGPDKFWALQWRELGVFLVASALLGIFCFWWIRRRVA